MGREHTIPSESQVRELADLAWDYQKHAYVFTGTKVGAAVLADDGNTFGGCNIEHRFRSHDVHAEVSAIATMVSAGARKLMAIVIVARRQGFTPCGACMDWILQFGGSECTVGCQSEPGGRITMHRAGDLMPHYPGMAL